MISVIIPVFNQAEYLPDCIESVLSQVADLFSYELIIVDDGSTDNSLEIALDYWQKNRSIVSVYHQTNRGLAAARNTGVMNARSTYVLPLDADDLLKENAIAVLTDIITKSGADVVASSFETFGTSNEKIYLTPEPKLEDFRTGNKLGYCAAINKLVLESIGGYNPKMVEGYEDLYLWMDLLSRGKSIITIPDILWKYRTKAESMWTKITPEIHQKLLDQINKDVPAAQLNFVR